MGQGTRGIQHEQVRLLFSFKGAIAVATIATRGKEGGTCYVYEMNNMQGTSMGVRVGVAWGVWRHTLVASALLHNTSPLACRRSQHT